MIVPLLFVPMLALSVAYSPAWDGPIPIVPEMVSTPPPVAPSDNAYQDLLDFSHKHPAGKENPFNKLTNDPDEFSLKHQAELLQLCAPLQTLLQDMRSKPHFQSGFYFKEKWVPTAVIQRNLAQYQRLRTRYTLHKGNPQQALQYACDSIRFAVFLTENHGSLIDEMIGSLMLGMAIEDAEWVLSQAPYLSPSPVVRALMEVPDMRRNAWQAFQGEAYFMLNVLQAEERPLTFMQSGIVVLTWDFDAWWLKLPAPPLLYQPNNTVKLYLDSFASWEPYFLEEPAKRSDIPPPLPMKVETGLVNGIGTRVFNTSIAAMFERVVHTHLKKEAQAHALILMIFLSRDQQPPESWILDPFTGNPLAVSPDGNEILSAGWDQKTGTEDDLVFRIPESLRRRRN